jgi:hypothetical protein
MVGGYLIFMNLVVKMIRPLWNILIYLSQLGFTCKEDYMRVRNFPLSLTGIAFAWFTSLPRCTVGSWSQLEEKFYEYFRKTNEKRSIIIESSAKRGLLVGMKERINSDISKCSAIKAKQHNILTKSTTSQKTSLAIEKHEKRKKPARLDFPEAKVVIHLSSDYRTIDGDQAPTSNKGGLPACSESTGPTSKLAELITASPEPARSTSQPARSTSQSTKMTASAACPEPATLTSLFS